jgi:amino acid transporter
VLATLAVVIAAGLPHLKLETFAFWRAPRHDDLTGYAGLGAALIFAVYDYLGYYNIAYLGDEVKEPEKTIPRVIVISIPRHRSDLHRDAGLHHLRAAVRRRHRPRTLSSPTTSASSPGHRRRSGCR